MITAPLTDATKKGGLKEIIWNEVWEHAFQELKNRISHPPILKLRDVSEPFILQTDAFHIGIGTVLFQDSAGEKRPIAFASCKLQPRERNYSAIGCECLPLSRA